MKTKITSLEVKPPSQNFKPGRREVLVVISEFLNYRKGQMILNKEKIDEILSSPFAICVNKILIG